MVELNYISLEVLTWTMAWFNTIYVVEDEMYLLNVPQSMTTFIFEMISISSPVKRRRWRCDEYSRRHLTFTFVPIAIDFNFFFKLMSLLIWTRRSDVVLFSWNIVATGQSQRISSYYDCQILRLKQDVIDSRWIILVFPWCLPQSLAIFFVEH